MKVITKESSKTNRGKGLTLVFGRHDFSEGHLVVVLGAKGLYWLGLNCPASRIAKEWPQAELIEDAAVTKAVAQEIAQNWQQGIRDLSVPLVLCGTQFQIKVWKELLKIKAGKTVTYQDIAKKIGNPAAVRAVGSAVGKNPLSIVVPCHRVVNKDGKKINYGWGVKMKKALLKGEGAL